jgi:hypothetical protein
MDRNAEILRRDAKAPLCLAPLPRWRYEHAFSQTLREFLPADSDLLARGVDFLAGHHAHAQEFVGAVDQVIVTETPTISQIRGALVGVLGTSSRLAALAGSEDVLEALRETLADRFETEGGCLPEFCWEKGAAPLFLTRFKRAGLEVGHAEEGLSVHINDVYDDCARTVQLGLWIMAAAWRPEVVDAWLFASAYAFFRHTIPHHLTGPHGLLALIPQVIHELQKTPS